MLLHTFPLFSNCTASQILISSTPFSLIFTVCSLQAPLPWCSFPPRDQIHCPNVIQFSPFLPYLPRLGSMVHHYNGQLCTHTFHLFALLSSNTPTLESPSLGWLWFSYLCSRPGSWQRGWRKQFLQIHVYWHGTVGDDWQSLAVSLEHFLFSKLTISHILFLVKHLLHSSPSSFSADDPALYLILRWSPQSKRCTASIFLVFCSLLHPQSCAQQVLGRQCSRNSW